MSRMAEIAYDLDRVGPSADWMAVVARVAERLSILGHNQTSAELAQLSADLRGLFLPPTCRWCGQALAATRSYHALGAHFCSRECMDDALLIPDPEDA